MSTDQADEKSRFEEMLWMHYGITLRDHCTFQINHRSVRYPAGGIVGGILGATRFMSAFLHNW